MAGIAITPRTRFAHDHRRVHYAIRGFKLLLLGLICQLTLCFANAETQFSDGHIGILTGRVKDSDFLTVEYVAAHSSAAEAGIKKGDWIISINGVSSQGISPMSPWPYGGRNIGDVVKLTIRHAGSSDQQVSIVRRSFMDTFLPAATEGDPRAEVLMGRFCAFGPPSARNVPKGVEWFRKSADQGYALAEGYLGYMYQHGAGVAEDQVAAAAWYRKGATQGDVVAERGLAEQYYWGRGVKQSYRDAFAWFYSAARQDDPEAEQYLGYLYLKGRGVVINDRDAFAWYYRSATHGYAAGETSLAEQYYFGKGVRQSDRDAFAWFYSAAAQDDPEAEEYLGFLYRTGRGVARNDLDAFAWCYRSAQLNNSYGQWGLAYMYLKGLGVKRDAGEALKWYEKAQAGLPQNEKLRRELATASLKAFVENPDSGSLNSSLIMEVYRVPMVVAFIFLAVFYAAGGLVLFYFTFRACDTPPKIPVVIGWVVFYLESQGVAMLAVLIFCKTLSAEGYFLTVSLFSALPVILSACGPNRNRVWKASRFSWKTLLFYGAGSWLAIFIIFFGCHEISLLVSRGSIQSQSTQALISKVKHASLWVAYSTVAFALPVTEELIFRGYVLESLRQRFSGKISVLISAFIFSLIHFQLLYFVPLFGFGLVLGWVRIKTDSLRLPVLLHVVNNGIFLAFAV